MEIVIFIGGLVVGIVLAKGVPYLLKKFDRMGYVCSGCGKTGYGGYAIGEPSNLPKGWSVFDEGGGSTSWRCPECK